MWGEGVWPSPCCWSIVCHVGREGGEGCLPVSHVGRGRGRGVAMGMQGLPSKSCPMCECVCGEGGVLLRECVCSFPNH